MSDIATCSLNSLVAIDPESLPLGTDYSFQFFYFDISSASNGRLQIPATPTTYAEAPSRARRVVKNGDVLMSAVRPNLKAFAYCDLPDENFVASTGFSVLRALNDNDPRFILYSILSDDVTRQIDSHVVGSNYPAINSSDVRRLQIPAWKPETQRRIATILSTLDEVIAAAEKLVEKHQQIKAGLMHDLFTRGLWTRPELARGDHHGLPCESTAQQGQLRPKPEEAPGLYQDSPIGLIPKAWKVVRLDRCVPESRPIVYGILMPGTGHEGGIPVIKVKDIRDERVDLSDILLTSPEIDQQYARAKTKAGDVLFTIRGSVGRVALVPDELDGANITQDTARISASGVDSSFLLGFLLSQSASKYATVHTLGVAVQGINLGELRAMPVVQPSPDEQKKIGIQLVAITTKIDTEKEHLAKLRQQKQGLMQDLLTGRVSVDAIALEATAS